MIQIQFRQQIFGHILSSFYGRPSVFVSSDSERALKAVDVFGLLVHVANVFSPVTVVWLGLPIITGITLILGVLRKELSLIMLATLLGTTNFAQVLTPVQMIVFTLVAMFYIPCIATIAALLREFGWKKALFTTVFEIVFAIGLGGIAFRLLMLII
jgi:ferrous iron transport protein B